MRRALIHCSNCGEEKEHTVIGFIPAGLIRDDTDYEWVNASTCSKCGGITPLEPTEEQLEKAEERYIRVLEIEGVITEKEANQILN